ERTARRAPTSFPNSELATKLVPRPSPTRRSSDLCAGWSASGRTRRRPSCAIRCGRGAARGVGGPDDGLPGPGPGGPAPAARKKRSEEHTSELQSPYELVCRHLLEARTGEPWDTTI